MVHRYTHGSSENLIGLTSCEIRKVCRAVGGLQWPRSVFQLVPLEICYTRENVSTYIYLP